MVVLFIFFNLFIWVIILLWGGGGDISDVCFVIWRVILVIVSRVFIVGKDNSSSSKCYFVFFLF